ncbi:MAG TPA: glycosyltransferase [Dehalococcoidia bacterium]|nr:glycosyltransferase [Dehalococcoidia bacterium]
MLQTVDIGGRSLASYEGVVAASIIEQLRSVAHDLQGVRVLHINATPYGGGVSELLRSTVPLYNDLGMIADWKIISGDTRFFDVTKKMHNGLQGGEQSLTAEEQDHYREISRANALALTEEYDVVFVHDPQPAGILPFHGRNHAQWIWRCHIDTGEPNPDVWRFCTQFLDDYDAGIFTMQEFVPPDFPGARIDIIPPAIDPLSPKNLALEDSTSRQVLDWIGIDLGRPLMTQVSRFDRWKDPLGVIAAYNLAKQRVPDLQLALVGSMALDDPEGWDVYRTVKEQTDKDPMIHVFTNLMGVGNIEVNAFQRLSNVMVQKSIREGFGLVVSESMWKETPVVAGRAGGIPLQMSDGVGGLLVDNVEQCADAVLKLLSNEGLSRELGSKGRERVREHFLLPRLLLNEISLIRDLLGDKGKTPLSASAYRDPVCGLTISDPEKAIKLVYGGFDFYFCSETCKARFLAGPARYIAARQRA